MEGTLDRKHRETMPDFALTTPLGRFPATHLIDKWERPS
jgi:hypothetical protein